jgi:hypothetical protein
MIISSWIMNEKRLHSKGSWTTKVSVSVNSWAVLWVSIGDTLTDRSASMTNRCCHRCSPCTSLLCIRTRTVVKQGQKNGFDWSTDCFAGVGAGFCGGALHGLWRPDKCKYAWPSYYACRPLDWCLFCTCSIVCLRQVQTVCYDDTPVHTWCPTERPWCSYLRHLQFPWFLHL